jgi:transposase
MILGTTTVSEHMPSSHRRYANWTIERIQRDAAIIGTSAAALRALILEARSHPKQGVMACLGIVLRLVKAFGPVRVEAAATRALEVGAPPSAPSNPSGQQSRSPDAPQPAFDDTTIHHRNIRGSRYYP